MSHEIAFYEIIEIIIGLLALGFECYAYYQDYIWDGWLTQFGFDLTKMCAAFSDKTSNIAPLLQSTGYFGDLDSGKIHMRLFYRNSTGEKGFIVTELLALMLTAIHLVFSCISKRIVVKAQYGAYIHGLALGFLIPTSLALVTNAFEIENSYKIMATYHPQCLNIVFCKEDGDLQDEIDNTKSDQIQADLTSANICQLFPMKITAAIFGAIHAIFCLIVVFVAMSVVTKHEEGAVGESSISEEVEDFFRVLSRKPSKSIHGRSKSAISVVQNSRVVVGAGSSCGVASNSKFSSRKSGPTKFSASTDNVSEKSDYIEDISVVRKLSPQSMYREYKFRKQRIAEMEREQNDGPQDPRLGQPGWDYDVDSFYEKNLAVESGNPNNPKRVYRKPKVVNVAEENQKKDAVEKPPIQAQRRMSKVNPQIPEPKSFWN